MPNGDIRGNHFQPTDSNDPEQGYNTLVSLLPGIILWIGQGRRCGGSLEPEMLMKVILKQDTSVQDRTGI
jgi:hypothetical protein